MNISIVEIRPATPNEWDEIWQECDYATYFHSREWSEIWRVYTKEDIWPDAKIVTFSDGKIALLPLSYRKMLKGFIRAYLSSPAGTFGGWISTDNINEEHGALLCEYLTKDLSCLVWRINPYSNFVFKTKLKFSNYDETHVLNLEDGFNAVYKMGSKSQRSSLNKARKSGISVKQASLLCEWKKYYGVYESSLQRWGDKTSSMYRWDFFYEIFRRNSPNIKLWLALYDNNIVAGALCFYAKKHVVYWHGAALEEYFKFRPVNFLVYEMVKNTCDQNYSWFDFNPSGGHKGVKVFKERFGATALPCPVVRIEKGFLGAIKKVKRIAKYALVRQRNNCLQK